MKSDDGTTDKDEACILILLRRPQHKSALLCQQIVVDQRQSFKHGVQGRQGAIATGQHKVAAAGHGGGSGGGGGKPQMEEGDGCGPASSRCRRAGHSGTGCIWLKDSPSAVDKATPSDGLLAEAAARRGVTVQPGGGEGEKRGQERERRKRERERERARANKREEREERAKREERTERARVK
jgi:hypothetical protein